MGRILTVTYIWARRCAVALIGGTVVLVGIVMIVTPGPALVVIPAGLGILSIEFACARRWLKQLKTTGTEVVGRTRLWLRPTAGPSRQQSGSIGNAIAVDSRHDERSTAKANKKTNYSRIP